MTVLDGIDDLGPLNDDPLIDDYTARCKRCGYEYDIFEDTMCPKCLRYMSLEAANTIDILTIGRKN